MENSLLTKVNEEVNKLNFKLKQEISVLHQHLTLKQTKVGELELKIALNVEEWKENLTMANETIHFFGGRSEEHERDK